MRLKGKTAVITGAGAGIGKGCALRFTQEGADVFLIDLDETSVNKTAKEIRAKGFPCTAIGGLDLTDPKQVQDCVSRIKTSRPEIDILVNAAAFGAFAWIEDLSYEQWKLTLSGELDIVFLITQSLWPLMKSSAKASIINFASANAYHALQGSPALAHCAGKGGVLAMTRQLAMEGAPHGIRANTISPGLIKTAATKAHIDGDPEFLKLALSKSMINRIGQPEDIASAALYLASDEASFVTGADLKVDGGATAW